MNSVEFGKVLERQMQRTIDILGSKAGEYARFSFRQHWKRNVTRQEVPHPTPGSKTLEG